MSKLSDALINNLNEMEFLTKTLASTHLYYLDHNQNLANIISETQFYLLNATLDLAIDLEHKINHQIDKTHLVHKVVEGLNNAYKNLHYFPIEHKVANFDEIEIEIEMIIDFVKEYAVSGYQRVAEFNSEEKKVLSSKIFIIKSRRTI
jgi:hypothetical protein